ncbi:MAG TPA: archaellin/type IV pilin N-terminal domain-containing protein [Candidatus Thermoplasmatota archaeon]|nr:archaellin/type IV pilin N-terminal domain-containing protein [Candidatus Thermoplasmatota archaeon]
MKANRAYKNDRAEVGVGTLIVFIAMVLVAAVAAAVLINTTGTLQQRAQATGKEATQEVSSNLKVLNIYGHRNDTSSNLDKLKLDVELSAGATALDLTKLIIRFSDGDAAYNYAYGWEGGNGFNTSWIRGTNASAVMQPGDLVELEVHTWPAGSAIGTRESISVSLVPETGSAVIADFKTPATYGTDKVITLR